MDKIIVTHYNPDLDAFLSVWLVKKFWPEWESAEIKFVAVGHRYTGEGQEPTPEKGKEDDSGVEVIDNHEVAHVDTGWGKFDHHDSDNFVCAASLVWEDIKRWKMDYELKDDEREAIEKLVAYALSWDHALFYEIDDDREIFQIYNVFDDLPKMAKSGEEIVDLGLRLIGLEFVIIRNWLFGKREFLDKKQDIESVLGKVVALESDYSGFGPIIYPMGYDMIVQVMPKSGQRVFSAKPSSKIDLSKIYEKINKIEPDCDWFLHASKKLLLCGSAKAGRRRLSSMSLERMIEMVK